MNKHFGRALLVAALTAGGPALQAQTQTPPEPPGSPQDAVVRLERELAELRREYSDRLASIEAQIEALRAATVEPKSEAPPEEPSSPTPVETPPSLAPSGPAASSSKVFNPDIAAIGNFVGAAGKSLYVLIKLYHWLG